MIDLRDAQNCIRIMKENGTYRGQRIGRVKTNVCGQVSRVSGIPGYLEGRTVLFYDELHPSDSQLCMGEWKGTKQRPTGTLTIESPLTQEAIDKQRARGSLLTTVGTIVGVPASYIEEIVIS